MSEEPEPVLLLPEAMDAEYRPLKKGEVIKLGDLFQAEGKRRKLTGEGMAYVFYRVENDTFVNGVELVGIAWSASYPAVLRPFAKPDFSHLRDAAPRVFCFTTKDMIKGEMIYIYVQPDGTLASDKLDFSTFNEPLQRSQAPVKPPPGTAIGEQGSLL